jgi:hypothetical protein
MRRSTVLAPETAMATLKEKGDLAELKVACDLRERGWGIAVPWGEDSDFDLIAYRDERVERVQVKYTESDGAVIPVHCASASLTNGRVRHRKRYTARTIDWLAVYDVTSGRCYYVPAGELGTGRRLLSLRLTPTRNSQRRGVRFAADYLTFADDPPRRQLAMR